MLTRTGSLSPRQCARHRANLVLTCVEMCDSQHPAQAQCGPEGLLRQLRQLAARAGVQLSGENALVSEAARNTHAQFGTTAVGLLIFVLMLTRLCFRLALC